MNRRVYGLISLMIVFLFGCGPQESPVFLSSSINLKLLKAGKSLIETNNCMVNEENLPGQAMRINGSAMRINGSEGGLLVGRVNPSASTSVIGSDLSNLFFSQNPVASSAILVVDDFNHGSFVLDKSVALLTKLDARMFANLKASGRYSHGALVMHHMNQLIEHTGLYKQLQSPDQDGISVWQNLQTRVYLLIIAVDTGLSDSRTIRDLTQRGLQNLHTGFQTKVGKIIIDGPVAINMSFAFMPCEIQDDFEASGLPSFESYMQKLWLKNSHLNLSYADFVKLIIQLSDQPGDPLLGLLQDPVQGANNHVYVASSGNYGLPYSMYPAAWSEVIGVSGSSADNPAQLNKRYFNSGEILELAAWFHLAPGSEVYYAGTSFSAPTVSVFSALDLASSQRCASGNGLSKLAHAGQTDYDYPLRKSASNNGAVEKLCP